MHRRGKRIIASGGRPPSLPQGIPSRSSRPGQPPPIKNSSSGCNVSSSSKRARQGPREGGHAEDAARKHAAWSAARPSMQGSYMVFTQHRALLRHEQMQLELRARQHQLSGAWQQHACCGSVEHEESESGHCCAMELPPCLELLEERTAKYISLRAIGSVTIPKWRCSQCNLSFHPDFLAFDLFPGTPSFPETLYHMEVLEDYEHLGLRGCVSSGKYMERFTKLVGLLNCDSHGNPINLASKAPSETSFTDTFSNYLAVKDQAASLQVDSSKWTFYISAHQIRAWKDDEPYFQALLEADGQEEAQEGAQSSSKRACLEHVNLTGSASTLPSSSGRERGRAPEFSATPEGPTQKGTTKAAEVDLIGKQVEVPGSAFGDHTPGINFRATVLGPDTSHTEAVVLCLPDNPHSRYSFRVSEVRDWLRMMHSRAAACDSGAEDQDTLNEEDLAARVLTSMSAGCQGTSSSPGCSSDTTTLMPPSTQQRQDPASKRMETQQQQQQRQQQQQQQQQQRQQRQQQESAGPATSQGRAGLSPHHSFLRWSSSEVIAQRPSLLPPSLAEQLARVSTLQHHRHSTCVGAGAQVPEQGGLLD